MNIQIKLLRHQHGLSLEQLAQKTGLTKSYLSKVERGRANPSISASLKIADALSADVTELFGTPAVEDSVCLVRQGDGLRISADTASERMLDILAASMPDKQMQPFVISPPLYFAEGPQLHGHPGEEFLIVLSGGIEIQFPERMEQLAQGDSVYFRANIPHQIRRCSSAPASALVVISKFPG